MPLRLKKQIYNMILKGGVYITSTLKGLNNVKETISTTRLIAPFV